jgi:hypothetical protein
VRVPDQVRERVPDQVLALDQEQELAPDREQEPEEDQQEESHPKEELEQDQTPEAWKMKRVLKMKELEEWSWGEIEDPVKQQVREIH